MAEIIDFTSNPLARLQQRLAEREAECDRLRQELNDTKAKIATLVSVNEMLKLALADLASTLANFYGELGSLVNNVNTLRSRLPTINSRLHGVRTQDRPEHERNPKPPASIETITPPTPPDATGPAPTDPTEK